jgi:hypothetical protein
VSRFQSANDPPPLFQLSNSASALLSCATSRHREDMWYMQIARNVRMHRQIRRYK